MPKNKGYLLKIVKRLLLVVFVISAFYVGASVSGYSKNTMFDKFMSQQTAQTSVSKGLAVKEKVDYTSFLEHIKGKKIFDSPRVKKQPARFQDSEKVKKLIDKLRLVGVLDGKKLKAIVENTKSSSTYYVSEGETFLEGIRAKKVSKESIILELDGEEFELYF